MAIHALKGRMGLLGMKELHAVAAALEAAIDSAQPAAELQLDLERGVAVMCAEIQRAITLAETPESTLEPVLGMLPPGLPPASVTRLIASLATGEADCDKLVSGCLVELEGTAWTPRLRQAQIHIQNFDFAAAGKVLANRGKEQADGG